MSVLYLFFHHIEGAASGMIELGRGTISVQKQFNQDFLNLLVLCLRESFYEVLHPDFSVVFQVLADKFIKVLPDYKSFVTNSVHYAGNKYYIVVPLLLAFRVEYHFHYFFGDTK